MAPAGRARGCALSLCVLLAWSASASAEPPTLILLSWDGLRHDYAERGDFPALTRLARDGARAERLVPPFPPNTFPAHVTLATGTHPDRHGIVNNRFEDARRGRFDYAKDADWIEAEPLWVAAERQGVRSAVFFWVGSETDWHGRGAHYRRTPFDTKVSEAEKVDQLLAWLDLPPPQRPRLLMAWWHGSDQAGHRRGPEHAEVGAALAEQDAQLGRLLAGIDARALWPSTTLLLVSDHGMAAAWRALDAGGALADAGVEARVVSGGGMALVYLADPARRDEARRALLALPNVSVFAPDEIPTRFRVRHPQRMGDLLLLTEPPAWFAREGLRQRLRAWILAGFGRSVGMHGYDPERDEMAGVFLALGRGVSPGARLGVVHAVDVAPTAAALLGIEPPLDAEGVARLGSPP